MFTAVVLVCAKAALGHSPETCYTVMNQVIAETYDQCVYQVQEGVNLKVFDHWDGDTGEPWTPVDFQCINWNSQKI